MIPIVKTAYRWYGQYSIESHELACRNFYYSAVPTKYTTISITNTSNNLHAARNL